MAEPFVRELGYLGIKRGLTCQDGMTTVRARKSSTSAAAAREDKAGSIEAKIKVFQDFGERLKRDLKAILDARDEINGQIAQ